VTLSGTWIWTAQLPPPLAGQVCTSSGNWTSPKYLAISMQMSDGTDASNALADVQPGDLMRLEQQTNSANFAVFEITEEGSLDAGFTQYGVSPYDSGGSLPADASVVSVVCPYELPPPDINEVAWWIEPAREPNRYLIHCECPHGEVVEMVATAPFGVPDASAVIPSTASNLRRRWGCHCVLYSPALP